MGIYVYGIIQSNEVESFGPIGIGGQDEVYTIPYQDLGAVVSDKLPPVHSTLPKEDIVRYLFSHQYAIETVMKRYTIVPFKFGTIATSAEEVMRILKQGYEKMGDALMAMTGKVELDVVAMWNKDSVFRDISQEKEVMEFQRGLGPNPSLEDKVKLGQMVEAYLESKKRKLAHEMVTVLAGVALDYCTHDTIDVSMIINSAFLIHKEELGSFDSKIEEIDEKNKDKVNFRRIGPLPPYSFSTIEVKKVNCEEIQKARILLGLGEKVIPSDVKKAYRILSAEYHPDTHPGDYEAKNTYEEISKAYELLNDYYSAGGHSLRYQDVKDFIGVDILRISEVINMGQPVKRKRSSNQLVVESG